MKTHCIRGHEFTEENTLKHSGSRHCLACRAIRGKARRAEDKKNGVIYPSHTRSEKRRACLKVLGWTPELWDKTWEEQNEKCSVCKKPLNLDLKQNGSRACADHEHIAPPRPRGILCTNCNAMIGQAQESPGILRAGAEYLEKFSLETAEDVKHLTVSA